MGLEALLEGIGTAVNKFFGNDTDPSQRGRKGPKDDGFYRPLPEVIVPPWRQESPSGPPLREKVSHAFRNISLLGFLQHVGFFRQPDYQHKDRMNYDGEVMSSQGTAHYNTGANGEKDRGAPEKASGLENAVVYTGYDTSMASISFDPFNIFSEDGYGENGASNPVASGSSIKVKRRLENWRRYQETENEYDDHHSKQRSWDEVLEEDRALLKQGFGVASSKYDASDVTAPANGGGRTRTQDNGDYGRRNNYGHQSWLNSIGGSPAEIGRVTDKEIAKLDEMEIFDLARLGYGFQSRISFHPKPVNPELTGTTIENTLNQGQQPEITPGKPYTSEKAETRGTYYENLKETFFGAVDKARKKYWLFEGFMQTLDTVIKPETMSEDIFSHVESFGEYLEKGAAQTCETFKPEGIKAGMKELKTYLIEGSCMAGRAVMDMFNPKSWKIDKAYK